MQHVFLLYALPSSFLSHDFVGLLSGGSLIVLAHLDMGCVRYFAEEALCGTKWDRVSVWERTDKISPGKVTSRYDKITCTLFINSDEKCAQSFIVLIHLDKYNKYVSSFSYHISFIHS